MGFCMVNVPTLDKEHKLFLQELESSYHFGMSLHYQVMRKEITGEEAVKLKKEFDANLPRLVQLRLNNKKWLEEHAY